MTRNTPASADTLPGLGPTSEESNVPKASTAAKFGDPRLPSRFWEKVAVQPDGCWRWTAAKNRNGYSKFFWNGTTPSAHAVAYKALIGDLREGFQVDHRCHDPNTCRGEECLHRLCVNPAHLAAVTRAENMSIGRARRAKSEKTLSVHQEEKVHQKRDTASAGWRQVKPKKTNKLGKQHK